MTQRSLEYDKSSFYCLIEGKHSKVCLFLNGNPSMRGKKKVNYVKFLYFVLLITEGDKFRGLTKVKKLQFYHGRKSDYFEQVETVYVYNFTAHARKWVWLSISSESGFENMAEKRSEAGIWFVNKKYFFVICRRTEKGCMLVWLLTVKFSI